MAWQKRPRFAQIKLESGYRSKFEESLAKQMEEANVSFLYEHKKFDYVVPERKATYTPDFFLPNGIVIEAKACSLEAKDRQKLILVKEAHPELDLRLIFSRGNTPIYKGSKTTYAEWAESHGFLWAEKRIPKSWLTSQ
jgi:hypothetical protein